MSVRARIRRELAHRAPRLEEAAVRSRWRAKNKDRLLRAGDDPSGAAGRLLADMRREGITHGEFSELFSPPSLLNEAAAAAQELVRAHRAEKEAPGSIKPFLIRVHPGRFSLDDPFARIALDPGLLDVVNRYLGMQSMLLALDVWLTIPTEGPATETQLWHVDNDDHMVAKLFLYFSDVAEADGPFCYAPRTHPLGALRHSPPEHLPNGRTTDEQMAAVVPERDWDVCTGSRGSFVLADTCGFHKQLKPTTGERLLMIAEYTSGTPNWERGMTIDVPVGELTESQRYAVR